MVTSNEQTLNRICASATGVTVQRGGSVILDNIDLEIANREFVSCVGRSGSGKTTLTLSLAGFLAPTRGLITRPKRIGIVFQTYSVFTWLTVYENVAFGVRSMPSAHRREYVNDILTLLGLTAHAQKYPAQLSGGQAQRVALARAIAPDPELILLDEPFGALDVLTRSEAVQWLSDVWEATHKAAFLVTHSVDEALMLSDRIIVMENGRICDEFRVNLPRPRCEETLLADNEIGELRRELKKAIRGSTIIGK